MKSAAVASTIALGISTITLSWLTYRALRKRRYKQQQQSAPDADKWQHIGSLKEVMIYPVKSCAALKLEKADCNEFGLSWKCFRDRCLIVLNDDAIGKLARTGPYPRMWSIKSEIISDDVICLTAPDLPPLLLAVHELLADTRPIRVKRMHGYSIKLIECQSEQHVWFSRAILQQEQGLRLYIALDPILETSLWREIKHDFVPVMVVHEKSVQDLNTRLSAENKAHHLQFRGNLLIESFEGVKAWDEDNWLWLKIGENSDTATILRFNSACLRCIVININTETCERNADFEPLKTLKKFRLRSDPAEPEMGVYFDLFKAGEVKQGDPVYVQYKIKK